MKVTTKQIIRLKRAMEFLMKQNLDINDDIQKDYDKFMEKEWVY